MKVILAIGRPNIYDFTDGISTRFWTKRELILKSLTERLKFPEKDIFLLEPSGALGSGEKFKKDLESIFLEYPKEDICLFYAGHGQEDGWGLSGEKDVEAMTYEQLALVLACHSGNLIMVNYCCFAGAAKNVFAHHGGESLLIAAMPENISGCADNFCRLVLEHWAGQKYFNPHIARESREYIPPVEGRECLQSLIFSNMRSAL